MLQYLASGFDAQDHQQAMRLLQKIFFRLRYQFGVRPHLRKLWWQMQGARFGLGTGVPRLMITWPHQVSVGARCILEDDIFFKYDGYWQPGPTIVIRDRAFIGRGCEFNIREGIEIGSDSLIASGCKFIDHDHEMTMGGGPMRGLSSLDAAIVIEEDVWLGVNAVVLKGVTVRRGAVIGAGAVVTKSVPAYEIWAGIPARKIGERARREAASR